MSFLLIWKCSMDKVMILRGIKTDRNDTYPIEGLKCTDGKQEDFMEQWIERRLNIKMR